VKPVDRLRVAGISGSLRRQSVTSALVAAAARVARADVTVTVVCGLEDLPAFNPDVSDWNTPGAVLEFREKLESCDAVLIASPEYAGGVPGVLKNALDWTVASGELIGKPVALINTSWRTTHAWRSLIETLTVMSARVIPEASLTIPLRGRILDADGIVADGELSTLLRSVIDAIAASARQEA
jgi:NAD(P)H-dependent FMN reductase